MTARVQSGRPGTRIHSRSRLTFDAPGGRTRLAVSDLGAPLRVMRGFELADGRLLVQIISAAPGLFSGDHYEFAIDVQPAARAVVLTPAATKIHSMPDGGCAVQSIQASVAPGASLEIYPTLSIPFAQSDFRQEVDVSIAANARFGWLDPWSFGRIARGERYEFRRVSTRLHVNRDGRPLYRDAMELEPAKGDASGWGLLEQATHAISGCWFGPCKPWPPQGALGSDLVFGRLGDDGMYVRGLFRESASLQLALESVQAGVCRAWGVAPIPLEQFTL